MKRSRNRFSRRYDTHTRSVDSMQMANASSKQCALVAAMADQLKTIDATFKRFHSRIARNWGRLSAKLIEWNRLESHARLFSCFVWHLIDSNLVHLKTWPLRWNRSRCGMRDRRQLSSVKSQANWRPTWFRLVHTVRLGSANFESTNFKTANAHPFPHVDRDAESFIKQKQILSFNFISSMDAISQNQRECYRWQ